jgi:hypothetical protein
MKTDQKINNSSQNPKNNAHLTSFKVGDDKRNDKKGSKFFCDAQ